MNWRERDKLIQAIFENGILFIKDTGVKIIVEYFGTDLELNKVFNDKNSRKTYLCRIEFKSPPTTKSIKMCNKFNIRRCTSTNQTEIEAEIDLDKLSLIPFETKTAKLLYGQKNKKWNK